MNTTTINARLLAAYRRAEYWCQVDQNKVLVRIGARHPALDQLLTDELPCWSIISACNPGSKIVDPQRNSAANRRLEEILEQRRYPYWQAWAADPDHVWPDETGFLVLLPHREMGIALGRSFAQNAVVIGSKHTAAEIHCCLVPP